MPVETKLDLALWSEQQATWPRTGRHVLAQYDEHSIVVYQAYRTSIARYAVEHGRLGGPELSMSRMSWIKPNFLWIMFRSGWATKEGQEAVLAIRMKREDFDRILRDAVPSSFVPERYLSRAAWQEDVARSDVRMQWDPDHDPSGAPLERRAIQLGLRGPTFARFVTEWTLEVEDVTALVREQHAHVTNRANLRTPRESAYPAPDAATAKRLGLSIIS